jgi:DNA-binding CsgD family transcriptional regulator
VFEGLGALRWAETARRELGAISGRQAASEGLTAAERRVAELVAAGRTNREVAMALYLTERTIESHLSRVYAKLGVRSAPSSPPGTPPTSADRPPTFVDVHVSERDAAPVGSVSEVIRT